MEYTRRTAQTSLFDDTPEAIYHDDPVPVTRNPGPHPTPAASPPTAPFVFKFLISYHYFQKINLDDLVARLDVPVQVFADCGGFSAKTQGVTIDIDEFIAWCHKWSHHLTSIANLDVIGDAAATALNQPIMEAGGVDALPVFHVWEDPRYLEAYCEQYPYVCLGGMVGYTSDVRKWMDDCFVIGAKYDTVFHGFGQTSPDYLMEFPFYSADSTAWSKGYRFGVMDLWDAEHNRFVDCQLFSSDVPKYADLIRDHGIDPIRFTTKPDPEHPTEYDYHSRYALGVAVVAWTRFANYLKATKDPVHLREPHLYLAAKEPDVKKAAAMIPQVGPHLYLAGLDTDPRRTSEAITEVIRPTLAVPGPHLYLVDAAPSNLVEATTHARNYLKDGQ